jgi:hypothetical protein
MRSLTATTSFTANGNSAVIDLRLVFAISMMTASGAGTTGTVKIQVSNDETNPSNWVDLPSGSITVTAATVQLMSRTEVCYKWARVNLSSLAGSAGIVVKVNGLGQ